MVSNVQQVVVTVMFHSQRARGGGGREPYCNYQEKPGRHEPSDQNRILITQRGFPANLCIDDSQQLRVRSLKIMLALPSVHLIKARL